MSIFEIIMLICFGAAWPASIYKSYVSRTAKGKSIFFLYIILAGYASGALHKLYFNMDPVIWLYVLNGVLITVDIALYYRNQILDRESVKLGSL